LRFVVYNANATAGAATLYLDDFSLGPQTAPMGPAVTDWNSNLTFTLSSGFGTVTQSVIMSRRVGDSLQVYGSWNNGTVSAASASIGLPSGLSIDSSKINTNNPIQKIGKWSQLLSSSSSLQNAGNGGDVFYDGSNNTTVFFATNGQSNVYHKDNVNAFIASGTCFTFDFIVPIVGWSSNTSMSSDTDTRVVAAYMTASATTQTISAGAGPTTVQFNTVGSDTHGAFNTGTYTYTVPVSGYYEINGHISVSTYSGAYSVCILLLKNGSIVASPYYEHDSATPSGGWNYNFLQLCKAGDTLAIQISNNNPGSNSYNIFGDGINVGATNLCIKRLSGPAVISATESESFSANTSTTAASSSTPYIFTVVDHNNHGGYNPSTGIYTAPITGKYQFTASAYDSGSSFYIILYKNGAASAQGSLTTSVCNVTYTCAMNAGDTMQVRPNTNATGSGGAAAMFFCGFRIGN
jgi:hypothetical protein